MSDIVLVHGGTYESHHPSFPVDHTPLLTAPDKVVGVILEAAIHNCT